MPLLLELRGLEVVQPCLCTNLCCKYINDVELSDFPNQEGNWDEQRRRTDSSHDDLPWSLPRALRAAHGQVPHPQRHLAWPRDARCSVPIVFPVQEAAPLSGEGATNRGSAALSVNFSGHFLNPDTSLIRESSFHDSAFVSSKWSREELLAELHTIRDWRRDTAFKCLPDVRVTLTVCISDVQR
jgi:hypothetical protein